MKLHLIQGWKQNITATPDNSTLIDQEVIFDTSLRSQTSSRYSSQNQYAFNSVSWHDTWRVVKMPVVEKKENYETILLEGEQNAPVTTRADLATNLCAQSLIRTMQIWGRRFHLDENKRSISLCIFSVHLDENEAHHFICSRNKKSRKPDGRILDRSMSTLPVCLSSQILDSYPLREHILVRSTWMLVLLKV